VSSGTSTAIASPRSSFSVVVVKPDGCVTAVWRPFPS
jgi:hypothetical protein